VSDKNTVGDSLKEMLKDASQQIKGRLSNLYFSYIITSLVAFNWQNILMLCMSDSKIEKILGDWNGDPTFAQDYFWTPVVVGYFASVVLPFLSIPIAFILSLFSLIIKRAEDVATNTIESISNFFGGFVDRIKANKVETSNHYKKLKYEIEYNQTRVKN